jgi:hypothetical protein
VSVAKGTCTRAKPRWLAVLFLDRSTCRLATPWRIDEHPERMPVGPPGGIPTGAQHGLGPNKPHMLRVLHYRCNASPDGELIVGCARAVIVLFAGSRYTAS